MLEFNVRQKSRQFLYMIRFILFSAHVSHRNSNCTNEVSTVNKCRNPATDADHTVLSGVVIDWGHGWGWGQAAWAAQTACTLDTAISTNLTCHAAQDYTLGGYEEVDWSAFGDFSF